MDLLGTHQALDAIATRTGCERERAPADDEYDAMEEWFGASFPVEVEITTGSLSDILPAELVGLEGSDVDEYEIDLDPSESSGGAYDVHPLSRSPVDGGDPVCSTPVCEVPSAWAGVIAPSTEVEPDLVTDEVVQTQVFMRRQRGDSVMEAPSSSTPSGCGQCKSNLNGKLIIRCASCSFRRHLYCFTPPLTQHPAFQEQLPLVTAQGKKVRARPSAEAIARWNCGDCRQKLLANQAPEDSKPRRWHLPPTSFDRATTIKAGKANRKLQRTDGNVQHSTAKQQRQHVAVNPFERVANAHLLSERSSSEENVLSPVQDRWRRPNDKSAFDWYAFRADKVRKIVSQKGGGGKPNALVYYSKPFADLKKTALSWIERVEQQKSFQRQRELVEVKTQLPLKRNVMRSLTEKELALIESSLLRRQRDAAEEMELFDDALAYQFDISLSRIRFLRQPRPVAQVPPILVDEEEQEDSNSIALLLGEIAEALAFAAEDANVSAPHDSSGPFAEGESAAKVKRAATVVQSTFILWGYEAKQRVKAKREQDLANAERMRRRTKAAASIRFLRSSIRSIILLMRKLRDAQVKKRLLLALQEASEDAQVANSAVNNAEKVKKLAEKRVQRFFVHPVRRYVALKKQMMSRRILRWWRRKYRQWRWRETAMTVRERNRERASRRIQQAYRRFRTKKAFREVLEKHALHKVQMCLRSWLMARVIKKEKARVEIYGLAVSIGVARCDVSTLRPDASMYAILLALGMGLYRTGDFWNAACVLERAWKLNPAGVDWEGRLALAYSHHMTWYSSYDAYNLTRSYETYCMALNDFFQRTSRDALGDIDPFILQDTAVVMMHMENFGGSLRMLARLIQFFAQHDAFPLWLLLAAVQLQQRGEWAQSVEYLTYIQDMPPSPYLERDILCLCAIGLERQKKDSDCRTASREAWSAAMRQWNLAQKELHPLEEKDLWSQPRKRAAPSTVRKWGMLNEFAQRAAAQGHYLLACRLMLYMLELGPSGGHEDPEAPAEQTENAAVWWNLADVFRHLGHLDLYVNAMKRSHLCVEPSGASGADFDRKRVAEWTRQAEDQAHSFQRDAEKLSVLEHIRKIHAQYSQ